MYLYTKPSDHPEAFVVDKTLDRLVAANYTCLWLDKTNLLSEEVKMIETTVKIDGMMCGMCEAHISDLIRKTLSDAKKVDVSRRKGEASFLTEKEPDVSILAEAITSMGYTCISTESVEYKKKRLFG